jgi:hypothetical protein
MSDEDIGMVVKTARRLETLLETRFGASGRGLHEKLAAVETMLTPEALRDGRYVATIRNRVVHEDSFSLPDRDRFVRCAAALEKALGGPATDGRPRFPLGVAICLGGFAIFALGRDIVTWWRPGPAQGSLLLILAWLMVAIPPTLWLRALIRRRGGSMTLFLLAVTLIFSVVVAVVYVPFELGRYLLAISRNRA